MCYNDGQRGAKKKNKTEQCKHSPHCFMRFALFANYDEGKDAR